MTFWLLQTLGDVDPDLVERAAQPPRKAHPLRWVAAVAAAAVMVAGVGVWWQHRPESQPPITDSNTPTGQTATSTTITTEPTTTTTTEPPAIGGDEWSCDAHNVWYHNFDGELIDYIGSERFAAYIESLPESRSPDRTYPYHDCPYPESNIVDCVKHFGITREQFIEAMGWEDVLDCTFADSIYMMDEPSRYLFTFGDYVDAIYGDDPHLTAWVFTADVSVLGWVRTDWTISISTHLIVIRSTLIRCMLMERTSYQSYCSLAGVNVSIIGYVEYAGITREQFIDIYGWADKLDEKATDHFAYAPYTYRQFVDAIYGDDEALRDWVFDRYVFHPDYPKAP